MRVRGFLGPCWWSLRCSAVLLAMGLTVLGCATLVAADAPDASTPVPPSTIPAGVPSDIFALVETGDLPAVRAAIANNPALLNTFDSEGYSPACIAARGRHRDMLEYMLTQVPIESKSRMGCTLLQEAIAAGRSDMALYLMERGADANAIQAQHLSVLDLCLLFPPGESPIEEFNAVVAHGGQFSPTLLRNESQRALAGAVRQKNLVAVDQLRAAGVRFPNAVDYEAVAARGMGTGEFENYFRIGSHSFEDRLIERGFDPTLYLYDAVIDNLVSRVEELIAAGADVNSSLYDHLPLLTRAIQIENTAMVRCLVEHGADLSKRDDWNETPVEEAMGRAPDVSAIMLRTLDRYPGHWQQAAWFVGVMIGLWLLFRWWRRFFSAPPGAPAPGSGSGDATGWETPLSLSSDQQQVWDRAWRYEKYLRTNAPLLMCSAIGLLGVIALDPLFGHASLLHISVNLFDLRLQGPLSQPGDWIGTFTSVHLWGLLLLAPTLATLFLWSSRELRFPRTVGMVFAVGSFGLAVASLLMSPVAWILDFDRVLAVLLGLQALIACVYGVMAVRYVRAAGRRIRLRNMLAPAQSKASDHVADVETAPGWDQVR